MSCRPYIGKYGGTPSLCPCCQQWRRSAQLVVIDYNPPGEYLFPMYNYLISSLTSDIDNLPTRWVVKPVLHLVRHYEKSTFAPSGKVVFWNTGVSTPPGAIAKVSNLNTTTRPFTRRWNRLLSYLMASHWSEGSLWVLCLTLEMDLGRHA